MIIIFDLIFWAVRGIVFDLSFDLLKYIQSYYALKTLMEFIITIVVKSIVFFEKINEVDKGLVS